MNTRRIRLAVIGILFVAAAIVYGQGDADPAPENPAITVLSVSDEAEYDRPGWSIAQNLRSATQIYIDDIIYPDAGTTLVVLCPDASVRTFLPQQLFANSRINCPKTNSLFIDQIGLRRPTPTRGVQRDDVPYILYPRSTAIFEQNISLIWHSIPDIDQYSVSISSEGRVVWQSPALLPNDVEQGDTTAQIELPVALDANIPYSVNICVAYPTLTTRCTDEPGWQSPISTSFYYMPSESIEDMLDNIATSLEGDEPARLFAQAVVLSQASQETPDGRRLGYYSLATQRLTELLGTYPESTFAISPDVYNLLGHLYQNMALHQSAAEQFVQARTLANEGTPAAALASFELGSLSSERDIAIQYFDETIQHYANFLQDDSLQAQLVQICDYIGDLCGALSYYRNE